MPATITGASGFQGSYPVKDMNYEYPLKMDLKPSSKLHERILRRVLNNAQASYSVMSQRHPQWREIDRTLTTYIKTDDYEKALKKSNPNKPVSIVVPHSYAVLETILAYEVKAFMIGGPLFIYEGVGPEDMVPAKLLELVIDQQVRRFKSTLSVYTGLRNGLAYGLHASPVWWESKYGRRPQEVDASTYSATGEMLKQGSVIQNVPTLLFEGNKIGAIDPYKYLPDPNVAPHLIQDGEFVGWVDESSYLNLLSDERQGNLFNVKYINQSGFATMESMYAGQDARTKGSTQVKEGYGATRPVTMIQMYCKVIPAEEGLPATQEGNEDGQYPEIWKFVVANDCIVIDASPLDLNHDRFPIAVNAPDFDGFSVAPISRLEMNAGLQNVLNWLFNSHTQNVRKAINDMFVVDPSLVNMEDLANPEPGKLLRLRRAAWGRGVDQAIKQLAVNDVTANNIHDAAMVMELINRASGAVDSIQGIMRTGGERRSAEEFRGTHGSAISRLELLAFITSQMYMGDLAYLCASHTQQLMSKEIYVKAVGEWPQVLAEEYGDANVALASPYNILADFDVVYKDGTSMTSEQMSLQFWDQTLQLIAANPELNQVFDVTRIFKKAARLHGAKDVNEFVRKGGSLQAKLVGDQAILNDVSKGNLIPMTKSLPALPGTSAVPDISTLLAATSGGGEGA